MSAKKIWIISLFPQYFLPLMEHGVVSRAFKQFLELKFLNPADFSEQSYKGVDDAPFGGGAGMVMRADVLQRALLEGVVAGGGYGEDWRSKIKVVFPSPRGKVWSTQLAKEVLEQTVNQDLDLVFICGRYEGIDERFTCQYVDWEFSLGDFILSGGEIATMAMLDSIARFAAGVLGNQASHEQESFETAALEHPHYTRPRVFEGEEVPAVLLSGDHKEIQKYREAESLRLTRLLRPDLLIKKRRPE